MRACARAPSAMLTTSTPPALSIFAAATARVGIEADRRVHLDRDDEAPARDLRGERAPLRRSGGGWTRPGRMARRRRRSTSARDRLVRRRVLGSVLDDGAGHARGGGDAPDVLGRRAAAAADEAHAELEHAARVDAEVLGRRDVDHALVDPAREAGVRRPRSTGAPIGDHLLDRGEDGHRAVGAVHADDARAPLPREPRRSRSASVPSAMRPRSSSETLRDDGHRAAAPPRPRPRPRRAARASGGWSRRRSRRRRPRRARAPARANAAFTFARSSRARPRRGSSRSARSRRRRRPGRRRPRARRARRRR